MSGFSEWTNVSLLVVGVGATMIVGSTVTGKTRSFAASHFASGVTVSDHAPSSASARS